MNRKFIFSLIIIGAFLLSMNAAGISAAPAARPPNDTFVMLNTTGEPDSVDPAVCYETRGGGIIQQVYETLLTYDGNSTTLVPHLATALPTITNGATTFTYTLRQDVNFTDGVHFDAYVMKYSIDRAILMNDPDGPAWMLSQAIKGAWDYLISDMTADNITDYLTAGGVVVNSQYSITFNLESAYIPFQAAMTYPVGAAVSPKAVIENAPTAWTEAGFTGELVTLAQIFPNATNRPDWFANFTHAGIVPGERHTWMESHAVGTGPYKLDKIESGVTVDFTRNDKWWKVEAGLVDLPAIKTVHSQIVAEASTRILALKNEEADGAYVPATNMPEIWEREENLPLKDTTNIVVNTGPSYSVMYFGFNMNDTIIDETVNSLVESADSEYDATGLEAWGPNHPTPAKAKAGNPFTALKFRQAFSYAFDYEAFIDTSLNGWGERMVGVIPNGMFGHDSALSDDLPDYNIQTAKTLFQEVGWKGKIVLSYNSGNDVRKAGCELLKDAIEGMKIGITVEINEAEWNSYLDLVRGQKLPLFFIGWAPDYADPDNYVDPFLKSTGTLAKRQAYVNPTVDTKIDQAKAETNNVARETLYKDIEKLAAEDFAVIYGYQAQNYLVSQWAVDGIEGFSMNPMASARAYWELSKNYEKPVPTDYYKGGSTPGFEIVIAILGIGALVMLRKRQE
jgi:peptide/nickel transport system substrate-binding protein